MAQEKEQESKGEDAQQENNQSQHGEQEEQEDNKVELQRGQHVVDDRPPSIVYGPSAPLPLTMTFGELLDYHAEVRPNKPAYISHVQNHTLSWSQLRDRSLQLARAFAQDGIVKGDLVALSMGSRVEYFEVCTTIALLMLTF